MEEKILDYEYSKEEKKNPIWKKRISGLIRYGVVIYSIAKLSYAGLYFTAEYFLFFSGLVLILGLWYNSRQGKYELSDKAIYSNDFFRYSSICAYFILIYYFISYELSLSFQVENLEPLAIILALLFINFRDLVQIPNEIKNQQS